MGPNEQQTRALHSGGHISQSRHGIIWIQYLLRWLAIGKPNSWTLLTNFCCAQSFNETHNHICLHACYASTLAAVLYAICSAFPLCTTPTPTLCYSPTPWAVETEWSEFKCLNPDPALSVDVAAWNNLLICFATGQVPIRTKSYDILLALERRRMCILWKLSFQI